LLTFLDDLPILITFLDDLLHVYDWFVLLVMTSLPVVDQQLIVDEKEHNGADAGEDSAQQYL
jgi:hypothetical protein